MNKTLIVIFLLLLSCATCFAQTTYKGLTPGKSTRADAERVLGRPVQSISATLIQYNGQGGWDKTYVQYRDGSTGSVVVERIELVCARPSDSGCNADLLLQLHREYDPESSALDAVKLLSDADGKKEIWYYGRPRYMIRTRRGFRQLQWGFYSKELYETLAPGGNCSGMLRGEWETNRGRMTIMRVDGSGTVRGTYAGNNRNFTGKSDILGVKGEWNDDTGAGTMYLQLPYPGTNEFTGEWKRTSGSGAPNGTWEGRCIETKSGGND